MSHGFVRTPDGQFTIFDAPAGMGAGQGTTPIGITDFGVIAGIYTDGSFVNHGFVRTPDGKITTFDPPGAVGGGAGTYNAFVNDFGVIAGSYYAADNNAQFGYLRWFAGQFTKFEAPKATAAAYFGTELAAIDLESTTTGWVFTNGVEVDGSMEFVAQAFVRDAQKFASFGAGFKRQGATPKSDSSVDGIHTLAGGGYVEHRMRAQSYLDDATRRRTATPRDVFDALVRIAARCNACRPTTIALRAGKRSRSIADGSPRGQLQI